MMDVKKALEEAGGDHDKAIEILRKKGQAIAAKRSDREAAEGCVLTHTEGGVATLVALKCETDFVAKNEDFVALTQSILNKACRLYTSRCVLETGLEGIIRRDGRNPLINSPYNARRGYALERAGISSSAYTRQRN